MFLECGITTGCHAADRMSLPVIMCTCATLAFHHSIRFLTSSYLSPLVLMGLIDRYPRPNSVSTALLVSSCTKLFPILMIIWEYDIPVAAKVLGWAVVANNVEAMNILLGCGYNIATMLAVTGAVFRLAIVHILLYLVDLHRMARRGAATSDDFLSGFAVEAGEWAGRLAIS
jgi:hypothetical protein